MAGGSHRVCFPPAPAPSSISRHPEPQNPTTHLFRAVDPLRETPCSDKHDLKVLVLRHEDSEVVVASQVGSLGLDVVADLLARARGDGDVAVGAGGGLAPDNNGTSWELWKLRGSNFVLLETGVRSELVGSLIGGVARKESAVGGVHSVGHG